MSGTTIRCVKNKYIVDIEFDIGTLEDNLLLEAAAARMDLKENAIKAAYVVIASNLYAKLDRDGESDMIWYFFDSSVRKWQECDDPNNESSP